MIEPLFIVARMCSFKDRMVFPNEDYLLSFCSCHLLMPVRRQVSFLLEGFHSALLRASHLACYGILLLMSESSSLILDLDICRHVDSPTNKHNEAIADLGLQTFLKMLLVDNFIRRLPSPALSHPCLVSSLTYSSEELSSRATVSVLAIHDTFVSAKFCVLSRRLAFDAMARSFDK